MPRYQIFAIQAIVAIIFSVVLIRMFYGAVNPVLVIGLACIMLGLALLSEYWKKRKSRNQEKK